MESSVSIVGCWMWSSKYSLDGSSNWLVDCQQSALKGAMPTQLYGVVLLKWNVWQECMFLETFSLQSLPPCSEKLLLTQTIFDAVLWKFQSRLHQVKQKSRVRSWEMLYWITGYYWDNDKATKSRTLWMRVIFLPESVSVDWCPTYIRKIVRCTDAMMIDMVWDVKELNEAGRYQWAGKLLKGHQSDFLATFPFL